MWRLAEYKEQKYKIKVFPVYWCQQSIITAGSMMVMVTTVQVYEIPGGKPQQHSLWNYIEDQKQPNNHKTSKFFTA